MLQTIHSAAAARKIDQAAIQEIGIPSLVLMEHAALALQKTTEKKFPDYHQFLIFCGPGNNGADGLALARLFYHHKQNVLVVLPENAHLSQEEEIQLSICKNLQIPIEDAGGFLDNPPFIDPGNTLIVDAIFGSGLSREVSGIYASMIHWINKSGCPILSVDVPSGLSGNTGEILGSAVHCTLCAALDCMKAGLLKKDGPSCFEEIKVLDIGIPSFLHHQQKDTILLLDKKYCASLIPKRAKNANKGTFGKVLMCGGSMAMQGALAMASSSCFHVGAGTITLYTPHEAAMALASKIDLDMILSADSQLGFFAPDAHERLKDLLDSYTLFTCGNGMGKGLGARNVTKTLLESDKPLVLDADGLNCLSMNMELLENRKNIILTPHIGEFARLMHQPITKILEDPIRAAEAFIQKYPDAVLVLKSDWTLIYSAKKKACLYHPTTALSKGGSGDTLCGIISGLYAQHMDPFDVACLGVWIHNASARHSKKAPAFFTPFDLIHGIDKELKALEKVAE